MVCTFGTALDLTADELRLELLFPGDDATARWLSGVRQQCEDRLAGALGQPVSLLLPNVGCA